MPSAEGHTLRFDYKEIAVLFSLFLFGSLFMFTVGILVGKSLALRPPEGVGQPRHMSALPSEDSGVQPSKHVLESLTRNQEPQPMTEAPTMQVEPARRAPRPHGSLAHRVPESQGRGASLQAEHLSPKKALTSTLVLKPQKGERSDVYSGTVMEHRSAPTEKLEAKLRKKNLIEDNASTTFNAKAKGDYIVQIGSFPNEQDALERVRHLRQLGFASAYFTPNELGESHETWYRVFSGTYASEAEAHQAGERLQKLSEVRTFLVRKNN